MPSLGTVIALILLIILAKPFNSEAQKIYCAPQICDTTYLQTNNDKELGLRSKKEALTIRNNLNRLIWGMDTITRKHNVRVDVDRDSTSEKTKKWNSVSRVDILKFYSETRLDFSTANNCCTNGVSSDQFFNHPITAYHFIPKKPNHESVILHQGHYNIKDGNIFGPPNFNLTQTINALTGKGYHVVFVYMPTMSPGEMNTYEGNFHSCLVRAKLQSGNGSSLKVFFEPTLYAINYLDSIYKSKTFHMIGLSGGGWTTTLYAAMDTRITTSIAVASGLMPHYLLRHNPGDLDAGDSMIYNTAGVQKLYALAGLGKRRKHIQVFIRHDSSSANGEALYNCGTDGKCNYPGIKNNIWDFKNDNRPTNLTYLNAVKDVRDRTQRFLRFKKGYFNIVLDTSTFLHQISQCAIDKIILNGIEGSNVPEIIK